MWFWIGFITAIVIMTVFILMPGSWLRVKEGARGPSKLQMITQVGDVKDTQKMLIEGNTGSLQAFVYPLAFQRTGQVSMCSDGSNPQPGEPDCNSGRFGICECVGTDCSRCKHIGYVNLLNVSNVLRLEMLTSPDASRQNAALVQLVLRTLRRKPTSAETQTVEETIVLPMIPLQKWTMITIARDGRRYDVYYNNKIVNSKRTEFVLDVNSAVGPIQAGDANIYGTITDIEVFSSRLTQAEVSSNYARLADTNGQPYSSKKDMNLKDFLPTCEGGNCIKGVTVRPASPLLDWDTQYA